MPEGLKLIVSADVTGAERNLKKLVSTAGQEGNKAGAALSGGLNKAAPLVAKSIDSVTTSVKKLSPRISELGTNLKALKFAVLDRREELIHTSDIARAKVLNNEIRQLETEMIKLQTIGASSMGAVGSGATKAFSALRTAALILPGIGIAGIFGAVFSGISSLFDGIGGKSEELKKKLAELIIPIQDIKDAAGAGTQEELSKVTALTNAVLNQSLSYKERNAALNQLKEINKGYFGDLTVETAALGLLKTRVDEYTAALINQAVIKAFSDNIGKVAVELIKQEQAFNDAGKEIKKFEKINADALKNRTNLNIPLQGFSPEGTKGLIDATKAFNDQGKVVGKLRDQMGALRTSIQEAVNESLKFKPLDTKDAKEGKDPTEGIIAQAKRIAEFLRKETHFIVNYEFSPLDTKPEALKKAQKFLDDVSKGNLKLRFDLELSGLEPPRPQEIQKFIEPIQEAFKNFQQGTGLTTIDLGTIGGISITQVELLNQYNDTLRKIGVELFKIKGIDFGTVTKQQLDLIVTGATQAAQVTKTLEQAIEAIATDSLSALIAGVAEAFAGESIGKGIKSFLMAISTGVQSLGKQLLGFAIAQKLALKAASSFNPVITAAAGAALIAIGALMSKAVNKGIDGFAGGGLVFGPTMGLVGEGRGTRRSNPEVIAPLDKLKNMMGDFGGRQVVVLRTVVSGNNLALVEARTSKKNKRLGASR